MTFRRETIRSVQSLAFVFISEFFAYYFPSLSHHFTGNSWCMFFVFVSLFFKDYFYADLKYKISSICIYINLSFIITFNRSLLILFLFLKVDFFVNYVDSLTHHSASHP